MESSVSAMARFCGGIAVNPLQELAADVFDIQNALPQHRIFAGSEEFAEMRFRIDDGSRSGASVHGNRIQKTLAKTLIARHGTMRYQQFTLDASAGHSGALSVPHNEFVKRSVHALLLGENIFDAISVPARREW